MAANKKYKAVILILSIALLLETMLLVFLLVSRHKKAPKPPLAARGKIAIILDDWGYNLDNMYIVDQIKYPFTASVLPRLAYSKEVALELHKRGVQIILHLPMEPLEKIGLEKNTITVSMGEDEIIKNIDCDLADISYAEGVSNHMGSKATGDLRTMNIVLKELKKRKLFFVDSFVSSKTVCSGLADKLKVKFIKRDIFLDNNL